MIQDEGIVKFTQITKDEFVSAGEYANSCIGHPEIAEAFGLEYNRESISLLPGDTLFIVTPGHRPKNALYNSVPEEKGWIYRKCEVLSYE
jgi:hypothetical protein